jgi:[acyl-carrier-protein] S-malonyltransferase
MNTAFIFPGQGAQYVGMAHNLFESFNEIKDLYDNANEILGFDLKNVSFFGPEEELKQTFITQPAIFCHSMALTLLVKKKLQANYTAGHSLGEYSSLVYSGCLSFEDGLKLVKERGRLMQKAGEENKGTMAAILGLDKDILIDVCRQASSVGIVQVANFNSPGQIVISGTVEGVRKAMELAKENKAKRAIELVVHGAFHSPLMESAKNEFKRILDDTEFHNINVPVYTNYTGLPLTSISTQEEIRVSLFNQITSSVLWQDCVSNMIKDGADNFVELGPGTVLQGLVKKINPSVSVSGFDKAESIK